jgi:hypothetical protein
MTPVLSRYMTKGSNALGTIPNSVMNSFIQTAWMRGGMAGRGAGG